MTNFFEKTSNKIRCIGELSEIKVRIEKYNDDIRLFGKLVLNINNEFIPFSFYTTKSFPNKYYQFIECFGIDYNVVENIDNSQYSLNESLIECGLCGKIESFKSDENCNVETLTHSENPTKLFIVANVNEYGFNIDYISRTDNVSYLDMSVKALPCKYKEGILSLLLNDNRKYPCKIDVRCDKRFLKEICKNALSDIKLIYNKETISNGIVTNVFSIPYAIVDIKETDFVLSKDEIENVMIQYKIMCDVKNKK